MVEQAESSVCPKCSELERRVAALESQLAGALSRLVAATKNSGNSSKPPSSDIVKAAVAGRKKKQKKRKKSAQPGHPKHERPAFPPELIDKTQDYAFDACPECGGKLEVLDQPASGVLGCDYFSAYRKYMRLNENVLVQFCLAHLIRDVRFLVDHPQAKNQAYGKRVLEAIRKLFGIIHEREKYRSEQDFRNDLENQAWQVWTVATHRVPQTKEARALADRFNNHGREYIRFVTTPGIEPTNNLAEQAIRFVVTDRRVTQGSRSPKGRNWLERIWTAIATCTQHDQSVFDFLHQSVKALFGDQPAPSLLFGAS